MMGFLCQLWGAYLLGFGPKGILEDAWSHDGGVAASCLGLTTHFGHQGRGWWYMGASINRGPQNRPHIL